ncbi:hypothetical protein [Mycobacteroides abscessus]|uniref:hypothetical protein n=1 Tax=Mycobacteroides abscessus TaxID=36809 RepID=UPI00034C2568|nr:hypothetical protein [Mycobacteroides abscessus]MBN7451768.1 hypothetical protein [Mycobacteroides abscessus subsp. abscessus]OLT88530.1 hypothetical protein BKG58_08780 [Mycobacteroides abscessus subsp. abscessus]PVB42501.1 hypothetical protein DDJ39_04915 [Mycobacteroides abscessus]CPR87403.1 Uncharacterised protein [Mycobacteroides abscessus]CPS57316.1 Uncharacterised protein [Mycobacteroides abscessus]
MITLRQALYSAAREWQEREDHPTYLWQLAKCVNMSKDTLRFDVLPKLGITVQYEQDDNSTKAPVAFISKADARKLMGFSDESLPVKVSDDDK